ncbi:MAG TPA: rod shape-determining protein MreC [Blastocatellia bacterium]|jgi:rod shape-determining protein MreC|nr:rod shape-determining protein MreC [Blastocatellia bacterium]HAF24713.1 rod shape-determining protein MreC [Blastocatellia bacterium]
MAAIRTQKEIRQRAPIWLAILLFANLVIMAVDARDNGTRQRLIRVWIQALASPAQSISSRASGAGSSFIGQIINFRKSAIENDRLKEELSQARLELRNAHETWAENERLKGLLSLKEKTGYDQVAARVIARDSSLWFNTITINRGTVNGVALNMPVVTAGGIVGRVIAVSPWTAQVMMITDEKAAAGAIVGQLSESGALGSVRGLGESGLIEMHYVSGLQKVEVGDYILTTGQDGIYPPGLSVGEVVQVKHGTATQPHQILIKPGAKLDQLEEVAVLLYHPPQRPAPEQTLPNVDKTRK